MVLPNGSQMKLLKQPRIQNPMAMSYAGCNMWKVIAFSWLRVVWMGMLIQL